MKEYEERSDGGLDITEGQTRLTLTADEADILWERLSQRRDSLRAPSGKKHVEIHLYQHDLSHLDELKASIPELHERGPIMKVLDARLETVSERALRVLKDYQIEYHIHPSLEEEDHYAQG